MNNQNGNPQHPQPAQQMPPIPQSKSGMAIAGFVLASLHCSLRFYQSLTTSHFFLQFLA